MGKKEKLIRKILSGRSDTNIPFSELLNLLVSLGFDHRQKGSHHILTKKGIRDRITLQESSGNAKAYQVRQIRNVLTENKIIDNE